jgi:7,8-dihydropterin-6-yl-methyl-4-(beta-D-ribofuranosyl)aminobenzene 5'-phosphate synthase
VEAPAEVVPGLWLTGPVPRACEFEAVAHPFVLDPAGQIEDPLVDDQSVFYRAAAGTVVLLGCAHSGVINTLRHVLDLTDGAPIHTVVGGMHLGSASPTRIAQTVAALRDLGVGRIAPMHCTGVAATHSIRNEFGESCLACPTGTFLELPSALAG